MYELTPLLDQEKEEPLYIQLYQYFKDEIQSGRLEAGVKLPSKRRLSQHLGISQNTVENAYGQLQAEGYIHSEPRKGIYVKKLEGDLYPYHSGIPLKSERVMEKHDEEEMIDFSHGQVDLAHFPYAVWRKLSMQALYEEESVLFLNGDPQGELELRQEITHYLFQSRGVRCKAEQIVIGAGTQYLIGLLTMIIGERAVYAVENPGFHRTRAVLEDRGFHPVSLALDEDGVSLKDLEASGANVIYVTPSHQFPLGMIMPISRRRGLLKWAEKEGRYIIEDDYDGEFRYKGKPIPSLQGLDSAGRVIYLGTFSKSLIPSLRISYLVLPPLLLENYQQSFTLYKQTVSRLHQHTLAQFMKNGHWSRHLNKMRGIYRKKQKTLLLAIAEYLGEHVQVIGEKSGLHILLQVNNQMSEAELIETAKKNKVKVYPASIYYEKSTKQHPPMILLGFGALAEEDIKEGIALLAHAWLRR
ncbi:MocR-like pyridoxine biosynthesis transcription factor PdxR [Bacillus benzoevorans]|uniref:GntR family transcriptional regulator/MocR family aminotransferase n=1 Tax=Bacillus benzoevorans TaxID=1456 RepID=A0A7X0LVZ5_9BACI|nr:PLP-dependent aminotransferase family protein [Bacillus benzoevorans]MBB6444794.1 GntR family transcriptional regulator/MocR family aminotransferase [Bacillus benzoevorans]